MLDNQNKAQFPEEVFKEALSIFVKDYDSCFEALNEKDLNEVKKLLHKIKGSSAVIGANELNTVANKLELKINQASLEECLEELRNNYQRLKSYINRTYLD